MIKRLSILAASLFIFLFVIVPSTAWAIDCSKEQPKTPADAIQCGTDQSAGVPSDTDAAGTLNNTVASIINLISVVVGVAAVIMIIVGGFRYITSAGNQESVKTAKNTIVYAIIGLVIVALAQVIVRFVLKETTSSTSTSTTNSITVSPRAAASPHQQMLTMVSVRIY